MAFPEDPLDAKIELQVGGVWTDITGDVLLRDIITHDRGRRDQGSRTDPASCTLTLNNKDGRYSRRNPLSPHYGLIGRNSPVRVSVLGPESYLALTGQSTDIASTPDTAALDITGDIDVRVELSADLGEVNTQILIGKWVTTGNQRSWMLHVDSGNLWFRWSTDGVTSSAGGRTLPALPGRAAVRATLDVDNGAGGCTVRLYWAESLDGPWTQAGADVVSGTPSGIFNSTAPLELSPSTFTVTPPWLPPTGRVHRAEVRSGIGGTIVASPDFHALTPGTAAFADGTGKTWTLAGAAEITDREARFTGEISEWPGRWETSGQAAWVPAQASGILRRYGQGTKALESTLRRRIPSGAPAAYWPMEEDRDATQAYSPIAGVAPLKVSGLEFAADDSLYGSKALPTTKAPASIAGQIPKTTATGWHVEAVYNLPALPPTLEQILRVQVAGAGMNSVVVLVSVSAVRVEIRDIEDAVLAFVSFTDADALAAFVGVWNRLQVFTAVSGGQTYVAAAWRDVVANSYSYARTVYTGVPGRASALTAAWGSALDGMTIGHLATWNGVAGTVTPAAAGVTTYESADSGFAGESAIERLRRLAAEEALPLVVYDGDLTLGAERMGPQRSATILSLLEECSEADGGILYEDRERLALRYRDRSSLYNQTPALVLDYTAREVAPPLEPVEDDSALRNDETVKRIGGSSARVVLEEGPLSVQDPPDGVGRYDEETSLNLYSDDQPEQIAGWRLYLGTVDGVRVPSVRILLHKAPHLIPDVLRLREGDLLRILHPPIWVGADTLDLIVEGYAEQIGVRTWEISFNCSPGSPWTVGVVDDPVLGRADTDGSSLGTAVSSAVAELEVHADVGPGWVTDPAEMPMDLRLGGEVVTATAVTNRTDTFARTVANSWGTSSSGHLWTEVGGVAADRSVDGSRGAITLSAPITNVRFQATVGDLADCEVRCRMSAGQVSTGASMVPAVLLRYVNTSTYYRARLHFGTGGALFLSVTRDTTQIGGTPTLPYTYTAGTEFEVRVLLTGHRIQMRVWPVGTEEPTVWHHDETIVTNTIASGAVGITASTFAGNTNVSPQAKFDQFEVVNPQRFTVTRAVNGITKAHAAGTDIRLAQPTIVAL
ncbi:hypothetical protein J7I98_04465 [Streptomyces sp. ISL-98]|uniref:hypothetical protein n=1 Tax=Streptomyces sp. ISL-98 TaxID=2819192 RepID=UPI001BEA0256|nr:hypothetical protein [Streptomyces sp. ISL-98]MBT2505162.1 hypothetical protein [Streptomyces sp. ISL-98]